ncbi:putative DNA helicase chromatin remodeling SNF2 family [Helianthus annuus]|nr:putative DNA helicase chromatin remodeling SNF2 family [Helianthus annuus]
MASKGPRSKLDHESRAKRQKALEAPKEPQRPRTHWDHLIEEMVWLSKDFESERKWKLALAKKIAIRASKGMVDQATRGERKVKEEELRMKKVALNISKDVKKFWTKIEKLVLYKHRLELDQKKKKALDKQLEFLLGQTERYSTMLAENLVDSSSKQHVPASSVQELPAVECKDQTDANGCTDPNVESRSNNLETDEDYKSENEPEDDEHTIEEDEALITEDERREELAALQNEADLPIEELLKRYAVGEASTDNTSEKTADVAEPNQAHEDVSQCNGNEASDDRSRKESHHHAESNGGLSPVSQKHHLEIKEHYVRKRKRLQQEQKKYLELDLNDENEDGDYILTNGDDKDDETTMLEEEELAKAESDDSIDEIALLQKESEIPIEDLLARYRQDPDVNDSESESERSSNSSRQKETEVDVHQEKEDEQDQMVDEDVDNEDRIADAAAAARSAQPTGNTFLTTKVRTKHPFLLKFSLREYQHIGLDWLVTMYEKRLNGILADEMGLGKTIMTIALLAHLACEKGIWGPHLIVVPTSVMLNWETEFLKWCPAFKILTYFGSAKERKHKRQGWMKQNSFHVCITTYRLVIQDSKIFKRKKWKYLILDEAHLIKNWKSQRWQTLLNFNAKRRILLTGTPLQNDLMELWSLMHFLMPHIFQSHQEFKDWFSNPISGMVEGQEKVNKEVVDRLHNVLRPFILRRLKRDVEKQLPGKHEHVIYCRLSRRQRNLYEDFIASSETQATLASSNFFGMISVIMQLRKVCNHPDLFEGRPIISSFDMNGIEMQFSSSVCSVLNVGPFSTVDLCGLGFVFTHHDFHMTSWESDDVQAIETPWRLIEKRVEEVGSEVKFGKKSNGFNIFEEIQKALHEERVKEMKERAESIAWWNSLRCKKKPVYSTSLRNLVSFQRPVLNSLKFSELVLSPVDRFEKMVDQVESFMFAIPAARAPQPIGWCSKSTTSVFVDQTYKSTCSNLLSPLLTPIRPAIAVDNQEFTEDTVVKPEDDELLNEEDGTIPVEENPQTPKWVDPNEEKGVDLVRVDDDDVDMMDDVKQMGAVSGNEILSFENQLRPIDRYAVRFLEMWDPIVDNKLLETQDRFEQTEWELDHIEKLKEDMEAEGDDDDEPIVYERWDSDFATKVYQEQVKALAEIQLMEEREMEAREKEKKELAELEAMKNETVVKKPKSKKKAKKTKFKSLKKEALSSETRTANIESSNVIDDDDDDDDLYEELIFVKKRKKPVEAIEVKVSKKSKKVKKIPEPSPLDLDSNSVPSPLDEPLKDLKLSGSNNDNREVDHKPIINRSKTGLKISITSMPVKRVMTIRLEKLKKGSIWPNDCFPVPDSWLPSEDSVLCAIVHEYGVNWSLASDVLYGMTAGGFYRGIVRHPVHCCERYRELVQKHVLSTFDNNIHNEKSSGKALLRVSEEHAKMLLDIVSELPDQAYTLQQHFCHLLASVWRSTTRYSQRKNLLTLRSQIFHNMGLNQTSRDPTRPQSQKMDCTNVSPMSRLVADALDGSQNIQKEDRVVSSVGETHNSRSVDALAVTLEFHPGRAYDQSVPLPPVVSVLLHDAESVPSEHVPGGGSNHFRSSKDIVECRFRDASRIAVANSLALPPSAFPIIDVKSRQPTKSHVSGKHKLSNSETPSKHSKSKSRKPVVDLNDPNLQSPSTIPSDLSSRFEIEASVQDVGFDNFFMLDTGHEGFDMVPHNYDMGFLSGLEDCLEFSDIG